MSFSRAYAELKIKTAGARKKPRRKNGHILWPEFLLVKGL